VFCAEAVRIFSRSHTLIVTSDTETFFQKILGDTSSSYLASVSTWVKLHLKLTTVYIHLTVFQADTYKYTSAGSFSKPYHFIDAQDNPPSSCNVDYSRDCGSTGCVVAAIKNYVRDL
jgi:hypothetical protein